MNLKPLKSTLFIFSFLSLGLTLAQPTHARLIFADEVFENNSEAFEIGADDSAANTDLSLRFGGLLTESLGWDSSNQRFVLSDDLRIEGNAAVIGQEFLANDHDASDSDGILNLGRSANNWESFQWDSASGIFTLSDDLSVGGDVDVNLNELLEARLENLGAEPTCNAGSTGRTYQNTVDGYAYVCDGSVFRKMVDAIHYHNGTSVNNTITATVAGVDTTGENTTIYLTDDGTVNGTLLFSDVYHVSAAAEEIQATLEAPAFHGYSYDSGTGALILKFLESNNAGLAILSGLEAEEATTPFTVFVVGI